MDGNALWKRSMRRYSLSTLLFVIACVYGYLAGYRSVWISGW